VRRMLLTQKSLVEGSRMLAVYCARQLDLEHAHPDAAARKAASKRAALLIPIVKAFFTDMGQEVASHAVQVYGGHGFIREWGIEQLMRDSRITQLYEGTNGIQALDLVGRKVVGSGGAFYKHFAEEIKAFTDSADSSLAEFIEPLKGAIANLELMTADLLERAKANPNEVGAASVEYLQ
ncbi:acyl-CoA dehydrogenase, partial [Myxococcus sp. AM001]|nr:acyl-CoA dehydrogenase [Myxococcus sp. AM001]